MSFKRRKLGMYRNPSILSQGNSAIKTVFCRTEPQNWITLPGDTNMTQYWKWDYTNFVGDPRYKIGATFLIYCKLYEQVRIKSAAIRYWYSEQGDVNSLNYKPILCWKAYDPDGSTGELDTAEKIKRRANTRFHRLDYRKIYTQTLYPKWPVTQLVYSHGTPTPQTHSIKFMGSGRDKRWMDTNMFITDTYKGMPNSFNGYAFVFENNMSTVSTSIDAYITVTFEFRGEHRFYDPASAKKVLDVVDNKPVG